jgi:DNA-binding response OmpR family regulator
MSRAKILIIEDERDLADSLALNLREEGYHVTLARRGISDGDARCI